MRPLTLLLALLPPPALALDAARCEWEVAGFSRYEHGHPVQDLGGGVIIQRIEVDDAHAARDGFPEPDRTVFEFCALGRALEVDGNHDPRVDDVVSLALDEVNKAVFNPEPVTLETLRDRIRATGIPARLLEAQPGESCGCALLYPGLR